MLTFCVIWLMLAATVTLLATRRKSAIASDEHTAFETKFSGKALTLLAAIYGLALLAGFVYVSGFLISSL